MPANITVKMNGNASGRKVTNAEWARIMAYAQAIYRTTDAQGTPVVLTEAQLVTRLADDFTMSLIDKAVRAEWDAAAKTAVAAVVPIVPTVDVAV